MLLCTPEVVVCVCCVLEAVEGMLCLLVALEMMCCVLICILEAVKGVHYVLELMRCVL